MAKHPDISIVIPLYNKEREISATLGSVLGQTMPPTEIIVVDDGSTDSGRAIVENMGSPLIRLICQPNAGVSAARNRGAREASGELIAFLDADDLWHEGYLEEISRLAERYPGCGAYSVAFDIIRGSKRYPNRSPEKEGIVEDFFRESMTRYVCSSSSTAIRKEAFAKTGGFPEGMKLAEDQYMWIKLADISNICFSPARLADYNLASSNRSVGIYSPEKTAFSFEDLYRPEEEGSLRNEYIAKCAISKAILLTVKGDTDFGLRTERFFGYTKLYRRGLRKLKILNRTPRKFRKTLHSLYQFMAWSIARKGF